jgi:hypothetical protein
MTVDLCLHESSTERINRVISLLPSEQSFRGESMVTPLSGRLKCFGRNSSNFHADLRESSSGLSDGIASKHNRGYVHQPVSRDQEVEGVRHAVGRCGDTRRDPTSMDDQLHRITVAAIPEISHPPKARQPQFCVVLKTINHRLYYPSLHYHHIIPDCCVT